MTTPTHAEAALHDILAEWNRQRDKWGIQDHDPARWVLILMEEIGEFCEEALRSLYQGDARHKAHHGLIVECTQIAAVALSILECLYREKWEWGKDGLHAGKEVKP